MSLQIKKIETFSLDQPKIDLIPDGKKTRPNIDHLLKRINAERSRERKNTLVITIVGIIMLAVISFVFTQA